MNTAAPLHNGQSPAVVHYLADYARIAAALPGAGAAWLKQIRTNALEGFAHQGFPNRHDEEWKFTSVAAFEKLAFHAQPDVQSHSELAALIQNFAIDHAAKHLLVFHNGAYVAALSSPGQLPAGVALRSVAEVLNTAPDLLQAYLSNDAQQAAFDALNAAFMADGAYLHLPRGVALDAPVHLLFLSTAAGSANYLRNIIVAEAGAQASVIEHYAGIDDTAYFTNTVTRIFTAENAKIEHHKLQQESDTAFHIAGIHAQQHRDSQLASHSFTFGAALARNDITTSFDATGCEATLNGLYLVAGKQHVDNHTRVDHRQAHGTSRENYRGVLEGMAHAVFNGKVIVHPYAQKTNASQLNHNLLLSKDAVIDTKPQLEIYADDVKCNHGATVGQLDETQLFYLRSRGIDTAVARNLLVHAFAHDVIEHIRIASLRDRLENILLARLPQAAQMKALS